jgi:hypothetical protein
MAGVTILTAGLPTRIGFVPQYRLFLTGGEWVMDGLKVAVEIFSQLGLAGEQRRYGRGRAWCLRTDPAQFLICLRLMFEDVCTDPGSD